MQIGGNLQPPSRRFREILHIAGHVFTGCGGCADFHAALAANQPLG